MPRAAVVGLALVAFAASGDAFHLGGARLPFTTTAATRSTCPTGRVGVSGWLSQRKVAAAPLRSVVPSLRMQATVQQTDVAMPALSSTMTEGKIVQWTKSEGDKISAGDILMVVESDKADMDVEAFEEGYLAKIMVEDGDSAAVGSTVALLAATEADIPTVAAAAGSVGGAPAAAPAPAPAAAAPAASSAAAPAPRPAGDRVIASPMAKSLAAERGIDLSAITGTGPEGRITASDVENFKPGSGGAKAEKKDEGPKIDRTGGGVIPSGTIIASPQAKKAAKKNKIDLKTVVGSGNFGRITEADVLAAAGKAPAGPKKTFAAPTRDIPELPDGPVKMSGMQSAVAANMMATMIAPSYRVARKIKTDKFDELYAAMKPKGVTVSALLSRAVALAIEKHPIINAHFDDASKSIVYHSDINIANAVAIDGGLITPVIQNCNMKDIMTVSGEWKDLVGKAKAGKLAPAEFQSGTFAISNLGMFGVSQFGSLLPPGTGSILAIGGSQEVVKMKDGKPVAVKEMEVTITCDHRHIYGADAALFLKTLAEIMEDDTLSIVL